MIVWCPSKVDSLITSLHHIIINKITKNKPKNIIKLPPKNPWKHITDPFIIIKAAIAVKKGQGLGSTKWKKWRWVFNIINK
jgi:hypothetical protein